MKCRHECRYFSDYLDGTLTRADMTRRIRKQIKTNPCCNSVFNTLLKTVEFCYVEEEVIVPEQVHDDLIDVVESEFKRLFEEF